ncbi:MAG: amidophosphoribosyltransferase [Candidatus Neomarinimicrobiota bacterium]
MCGVVGIKSHAPVAVELYESLIQLQHRGQDAAGIITYNKRFHVKKGVGLVRDIFDEHNMARLLGNIGIGQTRYPTAGGYGRDDAQPVWTGVPYGIAMAHNGNLVNQEETTTDLSQRFHRHLNTTVDVEVILHYFADALNRQADAPGDNGFFEHICNAVSIVYEHVSGAYSVVAMIIGKGLVVFRDPHGIRPLTKGERHNPDGTTDYIFCSETSVYYSLGFRHTGDVQPGEVIYLPEQGPPQSRVLKRQSLSPCVFEYVYFARPDTMMNAVSVYRARLRMGQNLAFRWQNKFPDDKPDIVIPAPSTANTAALSVAQALGVRYSEGLYKNPFIGRTFIMPGQEQRQKSVRYKLVPQELEIRGKIVMIVDDSIVRGTTSREIVKMVREFGAKKVYFISACPPVKFPCFYGVDIPTRQELIAHRLTEEEIAEYMGVDRLLFQRHDDLLEAVTRKGNHGIDRPCMACLDGQYVTGDVDENKMRQFETQQTTRE